MQVADEVINDLQLEADSVYVAQGGSFSPNSFPSPPSPLSRRYSEARSDRECLSPGQC